MTPKLCIALDLPTKAKNLTLCNALSKRANDIYLKIGLRSFIRDGSDFVKELQNLGFKIFLDLKLYDIPNTMLNAFDEIIALQVDIITIHASSGREAMKLIANHAKELKNAPLIFAVTALTSFNDDDFREIYNDSLSHSVLKFSQIASECGINGMVCSCFESRAIKQISPNLLTLTPAIRPISSDFGNKTSEMLELYENKDDQSRIASLDMAINALSDFVVIGRPIYQAKNPLALSEMILDKFEGLR